MELTLGANGGIGVSAQIGAKVVPQNAHFRNINGKMYTWNATRSEWVVYTPPPASGPSRMAPVNALQALINLFPNFGVHGLPVDQPRAQPGVGRLGVTNANFVIPSGFNQNAAGQPLLDAVNAFLAYTTANGVPPKTTTDAGQIAAVEAFQSAWNNDPTIAAAGGNALLDVDGSYGPNTMNALAVVNGGSAPGVNSSTAPSAVAPTAPSSTNTTTNTTTTTTTSTMPDWGPYVIGAAAVGGVALVGAAVINKHGGKIKGHASRIHAKLKHHAASMHHRLKRETKVFA